MRILVLTSVYALSEEDRHAAFLVESHAHLQAREHEIVVLAPSYHGLKSHTVRGVEVVRFRYFPKAWENLTHGEGAPRRVGNPFYFAMAIPYILFGTFAALRLARTREFDLIHVQWPFPHAIWGVMVRWFHHLPLVYTFHGAEVLLAERFGFVRVILKRMLGFADAVTCNSSFTAGKVKSLTSAHIDVIPYGASIEPKVRVQNPNRLATKVLLFAGRLIQRKGLSYLVQALAEVANHIDARLEIVGDGPEKDRCQTLVRDLGLDDRVHFRGVVSNQTLEELYCTADIFVLPSIVDENGDTEGLGVVLIEAMSFRTPVIATNVGGIPDVVQNDISGILVAEKDSGALASAILRLLQNDDLRRALGEAGYRRVLEHFDWSRHTDSLENAYLRAARKK